MTDTPTIPADQPVSGSEPEKVLAEAIRTERQARRAHDYTHEGCRIKAEDFTADAKRAAAILTAMPDHTIVRRSELEALRAVAEAAREAADPHAVIRRTGSVSALRDALARLIPEAKP